jgi:hypothetical protein
MPILEAPSFACFLSTENQPVNSNAKHRRYRPSKNNLQRPAPHASKSLNQRRLQPNAPRDDLNENSNSNDLH